MNKDTKKKLIIGLFVVGLIYVIYMNMTAQKAVSVSPTQTVDDIGLFDENAYYILHPDVQNAKINAKEHYCKWGYNEGRKIKNNNGALGVFDKEGYYVLHPDVKNANMDAFKHFCDYGFNEGRKIKISG